MNLLAQLNPWLNRPVRIGFVEAPPRAGRLVAVHTDYLTLLHGDQLLHCPLRHIGSVRRRLSAAQHDIFIELETELEALPATIAEWLENAAGAWVEFNAGALGQETGRLKGFDGFGFTLEEEAESGYHAAAQIRWISRRAEPLSSQERR